MTTFKIEKVANMVFITGGETVWQAWDEREFTERKLNNAMKRIQKNYQNPVTFERTF